MFSSIRFAKTIVSQKSLFKNTTRTFGAVNWHGTTIICVRKDGKVAMAGDGQVSMGSTVVKGNARKVRRLKDDIIVGFAGSTADAMTLLERLERKLEEHPGQLTRACVELAKAWRTEKYLRNLEAVLLVADSNHTFELTGNGDVLEPEHGVMGVGSGGNFAHAAALAMMDNPLLNAEDVVRKAMKIAGDMCVYTNHSVLCQTIGFDSEVSTTPNADSEGPHVPAPSVADVVISELDAPQNPSPDTNQEK